MISLFTDMASEMLYPVMPLYLKQVGYSAIFIGILEGICEAVAGLSKGYFGQWSDYRGKRLPYIRSGYTLSAISKPILIFFVYPWWIFFCRTLDRLGKGLRTGARDALLRDESHHTTRATVFGFHRSMDTAGAAIGPAIALCYLYFFPADYKTLFILAFFPGILAVISTRFIRENKIQVEQDAKKPRFFSFFNYWKTSNSNYRAVCTGLLLFALFNSSDVFLLLKLKESGLNDTYIIGIYIFYNLVYALLAYPAGIIADRLGIRKMIITGLILFIIVYAGFAYNTNLWVFIFLIALYGLYAAATEGISKAWISNIVAKNETATAIGTYSGFQSLASLFASSFSGFIWYTYGAKYTFLITAFITLCVVIYFLTLRVKVKNL